MHGPRVSSATVDGEAVVCDEAQLSSFPTQALTTFPRVRWRKAIASPGNRHPFD